MTTNTESGQNTYTPEGMMKKRREKIRDRRLRESARIIGIIPSKGNVVTLYSEGMHIA